MSDSQVPPVEPTLEWEPLYDKIIVRRAAAPDELAPGIVAAEAHKQQQNIGVVVKTGNGRWIDGVLYPLTVQVGNTVLFSKFAGTELEGEDKDLVILREDEILAWRF